MADEYDFTDKSEQDVLLSYVVNKGHRTRNVNKINNLLTLQDEKYSKVTEDTTGLSVGSGAVPGPP